MARRRLWWTVAAALAVAGAAVAAVTSSGDLRPVHFWVLTGQKDPRPYDRPDGSPIGRWWVDIHGAFLSYGREPYRLDMSCVSLVEAPSTIRSWLHGLHLASDPAASFTYSIAAAWSPNPPDWDRPGHWVECVDHPILFPEDALPDPALEGVWLTARLDGTESARWSLAPGGRVVDDQAEHPRQSRSARWGRIADVLYLDRGPTVTSDASDDRGDEVLTFLLSPDLQTWRARDGTRGQRCR